MRIKLKITQQNDAHIHFTVFEDGANTGSLVFSTTGFQEFWQSLILSKDMILEIERDNCCIKLGRDHIEASMCDKAYSESKVEEIYDTAKHFKIQQPLLD